MQDEQCLMIRIQMCERELQCVKLTTRETRRKRYYQNRNIDSYTYVDTDTHEYRYCKHSDIQGNRHIEIQTERQTETQTQIHLLASIYDQS